MDPMENVVRDVLREHASDAPTVVPEIRAHRRTTMWLVAGTSAAAVVVLAASLTLLRGDDSKGGSIAPPATGTTADPGPTVYAAPPGYRTVAYHEFTVDVPDDLPVLTVPCKLPDRYVIAENPNVMYDCVAGDAGAPTLTVRLSSASATWQDLGMHPETVNGIDVSIGYGTVDGYPGVAGQLTIGSGHDVGLMVTAPDRAAVEAILTSVREQADPNGCPAVPDTLDNAPADALLPPGAVSAVRCVYAPGPTDGDVLQASLRVRDDMFDEVIADIAALPAAGSATNRQPPFEFDLLLVAYGGGTTRTLSIVMSDPTVYSDGTHELADDANVVTDGLRAATSTGH